MDDSFRSLAVAILPVLIPDEVVSGVSLDLGAVCESKPVEGLIAPANGGLPTGGATSFRPTNSLILPGTVRDQAKLRGCKCNRLLQDWERYP
jgi:hypothetical protein